jgi:PEP-CTERM motif-containing protein
MKKLTYCAAVLTFVASFGASVRSYSAPLLAVDFGLTTTPVQAGFTGMTGGVVMGSKTDVIGPYTVTVQGEGFYTAGFNANNVDPSVAALYEDYYYHNSTTNGVGITLSIAAVTPNTPYNLTIWTYDEDNIFTDTPTAWGPAGGSNTSGTSGSILNRATPYPTNLSFNRTTIQVQSTTSTLDIFGTTTGGSGGTRLNGFQLDAVPEPGTTVLLLLGALLVAGRRKTFGTR